MGYQSTLAEGASEDGRQWCNISALRCVALRCVSLRQPRLRGLIMCCNDAS